MPTEQELREYLYQPGNPRAIRPHDTRSEQFWRRMKREPLIPLGMVATTFAFCGIAYHTRRRESRKAQLWMRARVVAQGLTIGAVVLGMYRLKNDTEEYNIRAAYVREQIEINKAREREELEERIRQAEEEQEAQRGLLDKWWRKKAPEAVPTTSEAAKSSKRWYHYLYWSRPSPQPEQKDDKSKA